jgi:hypothetical protein
VFSSGLVGWLVGWLVGRSVGQTGWNLYLLLFGFAQIVKCQMLLKMIIFCSLFALSDRERAAEGVKQKTVSLWSFVNSHLDVYRNPLYWSPATYQQVLVPIASVRHIILWKGHYCRWNPSMRPQVLCLYFVTFTAVNMKSVVL